MFPISFAFHELLIILQLHEWEAPQSLISSTRCIKGNNVHVYVSRMPFAIKFYQWRLTKLNVYYCLKCCIQVSSNNMKLDRVVYISMLDCTYQICIYIVNIYTLIQSHSSTLGNLISDKFLINSRNFLIYSWKSINSVKEFESSQNT